MRNQCAPSPTSSGASHRAASPIVDQQRPRGGATRPASGATTSATAGQHASSDLREAAQHRRPPRATGAHGVARHACEIARLLAPPHAAAARWSRSRFSFSDLKFKTLDTIMAIRMIRSEKHWL
ncbi:hypothetical protein F511_26256 [Dorcoceras hygrometricum]|uniref:Uncharacterized protein n=1 Tax=Dorcoceras hygrometricum TaxID=472368 RepID=A0A2Z7A467_9LAMI|nr:hypothetical protein F511_26256 [Dorcoceras hygrometricum]